MTVQLTLGSEINLGGKIVARNIIRPRSGGDPLVKATLELDDGDEVTVIWWESDLAPALGEQVKLRGTVKNYNGQLEVHVLKSATEQSGPNADPIARIIGFYIGCVEAEAASAAHVHLGSLGHIELTTGASPLSGSRSLPDDTVVDRWCHQREMGLGESLMAGWPMVIGRNPSFVASPLLTADVRLARSKHGWVLEPISGGVELNPYALDLLGVDRDERDILVKSVEESPAVDEAKLARDRATAILDVLRDNGVKGLSHLDPAELANYTKEVGVHNTGLLTVSTGSTQVTRMLLEDLEELLNNPAMLEDGPAAIMLGQTSESVDSPPRPHPTIIPSTLAQDIAVTSAMENVLTVVTGPPGTGKSQVLVNVVAAAVARNETVLFASKNNQAVDVVFERLALTSDNPCIVRAGPASRRGEVSESITKILSTAPKPDNFAPAQRVWGIVAERVRSIHDVITRRTRLQDYIHRLEVDLRDRLEVELHRIEADIRDRLEVELHRLEADLHDRLEVELHLLEIELHRLEADLHDRLEVELHRLEADLHDRLEIELHSLELDLSRSEVDLRTCQKALPYGVHIDVDLVCLYQAITTTAASLTTFGDRLGFFFRWKKHRQRLENSRHELTQLGELLGLERSMVEKPLSLVRDNPARTLAPRREFIELSETIDTIVKKIRLIRETQSEVIAKQAKVIAKQAEINDPRGAINHPQAAIRAKQAEINRCKAAISRKESEIDRHCSKVKAKQAEIDRRWAEVKAKRADIDRRQADLKAKQAKINYCRATIVRTESEIEALPTKQQLDDKLHAIGPERIEAGRALLDARWEQIRRENSVARKAAGELAELLKDATKSGVARRAKKLIPSALPTLSVWGVTNLSARTNLPLKRAMFDLVVIDEASQCDVASALPLLARAKRAMIIGDRRQLSHIASLGLQRERMIGQRCGLADDLIDRFSYRDRSCFGLASACVDEAPIFLDLHFRSHPAIIGFSNERFYSGRLELCSYNKPPPNQPALEWTRVNGDSQKGPQGRSQINPQEARALVNKLVQDAPAIRGLGLSIGVVAPYRAQADLILDLIRREVPDSLDDILEDVTVATAHRFQGDERDIIYFSPVVGRSMTKNQAGFAANVNLVNVALTRARRRLVIVGNMDVCLTHTNVLADLARYVNRLEAGAYDSPLEQTLHEALLRRGIPAQTGVVVDGHRLDLAVESNGQRLDIECDGAAFHTDVDRDAARDRAIEAQGWTVLRFSGRRLGSNLDCCVEEIVASLAEV